MLTSAPIVVSLSTAPCSISHCKKIWVTRTRTEWYSYWVRWRQQLYRAWWLPGERSQCGWRYRPDETDCWWYAWLSDFGYRLPTFAPVPVRSLKDLNIVGIDEVERLLYTISQKSLTWQRPSWRWRGFSRMARWTATTQFQEEFEAGLYGYTYLEDE